MSSRATRAIGIGAVGLLLIGWVTACSESKDTNPVITPRSGAYQPAPSGTTIDEATACDSLTAAVDAQRSALGCGSVQRAPCPDYIRPAGGSDCYVYDEGTVNECVSYYGKLSSCTAFEQAPCVITAVPTDACASASGGAGGSGGSGGSGGTAGGAGGTSGAGGTTGGTGGTTGGTGGTTGGTGGTTGGTGGTTGGSAGSA